MATGQTGSAALEGGLFTFSVLLRHQLQVPQYAATSLLIVSYVCVCAPIRAARLTVFSAVQMLYSVMSSP